MNKIFKYICMFLGGAGLSQTAKEAINYFDTGRVSPFAVYSILLLVGLFYVKVVIESLISAIEQDKEEQDAEESAKDLLIESQEGLINKQRDAIKLLTELNQLKENDKS